MKKALVLIRINCQYERAAMILIRWPNPIFLTRQNLHFLALIPTSYPIQSLSSRRLTNTLYPHRLIRMYHRRKLLWLKTLCIILILHFLIISRRKANHPKAYCSWATLQTIRIVHQYPYRRWKLQKDHWNSLYRLKLRQFRRRMRRMLRMSMIDIEYRLIDIYTLLFVLFACAFVHFSVLIFFDFFIFFFSSVLCNICNCLQCFICHQSFLFVVIQFIDFKSPVLLV